MKIQIHLLRNLLSFIWIVPILFSSCKKESIDDLEDDTMILSANDTVPLDQLVDPAFINNYNLWIMSGGLMSVQELSSDEMMIPTRGMDWYDGGLWRELYLLEWTPGNRDIESLFEELYEGILNSNYGLFWLDRREQTPEVIVSTAELYFLRSYFSYLMMDIFGQVPYKEISDTNRIVSPIPVERSAAFDSLITDLENKVLPNLPEFGSTQETRPSKDAARMLLAKLHLNQEVYTGTPGYVQCLSYVNEIINSGNYELSNDYWSIFSPDNDGNSEVIFSTSETYGNNNGRWNFHYQLSFYYEHQWDNVIIGGWNGIVAPENYCEMICNHTDTLLDMRWRDDRYYGTSNYIYLGYNYGQQYNFTSYDPIDNTPDKIETRPGDDLNYTFECSLIDAEEYNGVRVLKFYPRFMTNNPYEYDNNYPVFRIADAYLMRAECNYRLGSSTGASPVEDINVIRNIRNKAGDGTMAVTAIDVDLDFILAERAVELYRENHRRQDLIRFGKYLGPKSNKDYSSPEYCLLCPIPASQLALYPNMLQNPGY